MDICLYYPLCVNMVNAYRKYVKQVILKTKPTLLYWINLSISYKLFLHRGTARSQLNVSQMLLYAN